MGVDARWAVSLTVGAALAQNAVNAVPAGVDDEATRPSREDSRHAGAQELHVVVLVVGVVELREQVARVDAAPRVTQPVAIAVGATKR